MKTKDRRAFFSISITGFLIITTFSIVMPIFPLFLKTLGASAAIIGLIFGARYIEQIFFRVPFGSISDWLGRKLLIEIGCACLVVSQFLFFMTSDLRVILAASVLNGVGLALFWPVLQAAVSDVSGKGNVAERFGLYSTITDIGSIIGPFLGGWLAELYGYRLVLGISSLFALSALFFSFLLIPETFRREINQVSMVRDYKTEFFSALRPLPRTVLTMLKRPIILVIAVATFIEFFFFSILSAYYPLFARVNGLNDAEIGITVMCFGLISVPLRLHLGRFSDKMGRVMPIIMSLSSYTILLALIPIFPFFLSLTVFIALLGIFDGLIFVNSIAASTEAMGGEKKGLGTGFWGIVAYSGFTVSALSMGIVAEMNLTWVFYFASFLSLFFLLVVLLINSRHKLSLSIKSKKLIQWN